MLMNFQMHCKNGQCQHFTTNSMNLNAWMNFLFTVTNQMSNKTNITLLKFDQYVFYMYRVNGNGCELYSPTPHATFWHLFAQFILVLSLYVGKIVFQPPCRCFAHRTFCLHVLIRCMSTSLDLLWLFRTFYVCNETTNTPPNMRV